MATRIGEYVVSGELRNTRKNGVFGWIEFAPDYGIRVELTGNFGGSLGGKHIRFKPPTTDSMEVISPNDLPDVVSELADRQIGVVGDITMRVTRVPDIPIDDFLDLDPEEQKKHFREKNCLYLEWYSQNGHIIAEILDPIIEVIEIPVDDDDEVLFEPGTDGPFPPGFTDVHIDEDGVARTSHFELEGDDDLEEEDGDDDPYGLFGSDLDQRVAESLGTVDPDSEVEASPESSDAESNSKRAWEEVVPGIDSETKAMYEQWDEIFEGKKDQPISYLFETPLKLPKPENVSDNAEAESLVRAILAQLALLSVALDVCEHFEPLETYRLLMNEILPTARVHPNLAASEMVQHYSTSDFCSVCEAEFDAEYENSEGSGPEDTDPEDTEPADFDEADVDDPDMGDQDDAQDASG